jgi:hypothetical protein
MVGSLCLLLVSFVLTQSSTTATPSPPQKSPKQVESKAVDQIGAEMAEKLLKVKRMYVDSFGDDQAAKSLRAMIINALQSSKRFIITENKDKADATLKGHALEKTSQEFHASGEGTAVGVAAGSQSGSISGTVHGGTGHISGSHSGGFAATSLATEDSVASTETINDARLAVRLVSADGDVIWSTTQESNGAKYKGASADVADKITKQLLRDIEKLEKPSVAQPPK